MKNGAAYVFNWSGFVMELCILLLLDLMLLLSITVFLFLKRLLVNLFLVVS